jgi:hypothetical protein
VGHDAEYIASYVNQVDGSPFPNGQAALELAMRCIHGNGKSGPQSTHARLSLVDRVCGAPIARITRIR